jgi:hypothetical protein
MDRVFIPCVFLVGCAFLVSSGRAESLVLNGEFDNGTTVDGGISTADHWTDQNLDYYSGSPLSVGHGGWSSTGGNPGGTFWLNASGEAATDPLIFQDISGLTVGDTYTLTADYQVYPTGAGSAGGVLPDIGLSIDGNNYGFVANESDSSWHTVTESFTYQGLAPNSNRLTIATEMNGGDASALIDNVSLTDNAIVAAPLPASLPGGCALLGLLAAIKLGRRKRVAAILKQCAETD